MIYAGLILLYDYVYLFYLVLVSSIPICFKVL